MADEAKLRKDVHKGAKARQFFESPEYTEAVAGVKARLVDRWQGEARSEERDRIWLLLRAMDLITDELVSIANNGAVAAAQLEPK